MTEDKKKRKLTPRMQKVVDQARKNLQLRPLISDEEFMAETEVSDEQYKKGMTLPGGEGTLSMKELAEGGYMHNCDWNDSLFDSWLADGIQPDELEKGYEEMKPRYLAWLKKVGALGPDGRLSV